MDGVWALIIDPDALGRQPKVHINTRFRVTLRNKLDQPAIVHWHGFAPPNNLDGIPWISANPIQPNRSVYYDFNVFYRGFNWAHSHFGHQHEAGIFAPIIIRDHPEVREEFGNPQEVLMVLFDGHWRMECAYTHHLYPHHCPTGGFDNWEAYQFNVNGHDLRKGGAKTVHVENGKPVRLRILHAGNTAVFRVSFGGLQGEIIATDGMLVERGEKRKHVPIAVAERLDVLIDIPQKGGNFNIIACRINTHGDADNPERGVLVLKTPGAPSQKLPSPYGPTAVPPFDKKDWNKLYGDVTAKFGISEPHRKPDVHHVIHLTGEFDKFTGEWRPGFNINHGGIRVWPAPVWCKLQPGQSGWNLDDTVLNMVFCQGASITSNIPCDLYACKDDEKGRDEDGRCLPEGVTENAWEGIKVSDCGQWAPQPNTFRYNPDSLDVCFGDRVWITYVSETETEGHPMHLHGTHQQLVEVNGKPVVGALKDTWFVPHGMRITVAFDAVNPGEWLLHCHFGLHVSNGMATTVRYVLDSERCLKKNFDANPKWENTPPLPSSEWPDPWVQLWNKRDPQFGPARYDTDPVVGR
jgi:FtsP/CotA-like multicopper oxidase with cupredoxin domain